MIKNHEYKIIVAHPGRQHSYRLASALKKNNMLAYYITTIYNKPTSYLMRMAKCFLSEDNIKRMNGRKNKDLLNTDVIQYCELNGMIEAFLVRMDKSGCIYNVFRRHNADIFGEKVARLAIQKQVDAVILYDTNAKRCFQILKEQAPHIKRIMDISIAAGPYNKRIYQNEIDCSGNMILRSEQKFLWDKKNIELLQAEINDAQFFLAPSSFVMQSLLYCGVKQKQIQIVPYGANVSSNKTCKVLLENVSLQVLFVGTVDYRKGVPYLLRVLEKFDNTVIELTLVGAYNPNSEYVKKYKNNKNIHFVGRVTFDRMKQIYEKADVFVIDSFAEGMAQVGIEAMACGLPIICSYNSGVSDLVEEGKSGFVIPCGNVEILQEKLQWFIDNRDKIHEMGQAAKRVGSKYTWQYYEDNVIKAIESILAK